MNTCLPRGSQLGEWVGLDQTLALGYLRNRGTGFARLKAWGGGEADPVQTNYLASHVKSKDPLSFQVRQRNTMRPRRGGNRAAMQL